MRIHTWYIEVYQALKTIPNKKVVRSEIKEEEDKEAKAKPEDDEIEEVRRAVIQSLKTLLAT